MTEAAPRDLPYLLLDPDDHVVLGESDFGMPGLTAVESIGPFVSIQASGPLITVHDSVIEPRLGIGHHPHRYNERLFYIESGQLDHDDSLNGITGHVEAGGVAQFTEGQRGMMHSEWNHGDVETRCYILVYSTDPVPPLAAFHALPDAEAPRYDESEGVRTKELVGPRSPLQVNGDIRLFTDTWMEPGSAVDLSCGDAEGGLASVREGRMILDDGQPFAPGQTLVIPPAAGTRSVTMRAEESTRVIRVVHGPGHGFVTGRPYARR
ncbi:MAG TPA: pirin family protein [Actinomycetota bacterium]|nr:pirin family protein [Actinomycetota bacterium]